MQDLRNRNIIREIHKFVPSYKISASEKQLQILKQIKGFCGSRKILNTTKRSVKSVLLVPKQKCVQVRANWSGQRTTTDVLPKSSFTRKPKRIVIRMLSNMQTQSCNLWYNSPPMAQFPLRVVPTQYASMNTLHYKPVTDSSEIFKFCYNCSRKKYFV